MEERIEPKVGVVIVAGGSGRRAGGATPKQFQFLGNLPILAHTINAFAGALPSARLVVVLAEDRVKYWENLAARFDVAKHRVVVGGAERFDSVRSGVEVLEDVDLIAVHDGARPLVSKELIARCVECALSNGSAIPVVAVSDSLREVSEDGSSKQIDRSIVRAVQTPQIFDAITLRRGYSQASAQVLSQVSAQISGQTSGQTSGQISGQVSEQVKGGGFTDDASVVESIGERVWLCDGERSNIKITTREDIALARQILEERESGE